MVVYAQSSWAPDASEQSAWCDTCMQPPVELETYFSVMDALIWQLNSWTPPDADQWTGTGVGKDLSDVAFASKMVRNAWLSSAILADVLVTNSVNDVFAELTLLWWSESRRREWEMLLEYDHKIMMWVIALARSDRIGREVPVDLLDKVDAELKRLGFVNLKKSWESYNMRRAEAQYEDLAKMMRQMNYVMKELHINKRYSHLLQGVWEEYLRTFSKEKAAAYSQVEDAALAAVYQEVTVLILTAFGLLTWEMWWELTDWLEFTNDRADFAVRVRQIQDAYACSTWIKNLCNGWWSTAARMRDFTKDRAVVDASKAMDTFKLARSRLKWTLFKWDEEDKQAAKQREEALLQSIYGQDIPEYHKWWKQPWVDTTWSLPVDFESNIEPFPKSISATWKTIAKVRKKETDATKTKEKDTSWWSQPNTSDQENANNQKNAKQFDTKEQKEEKMETLKDYLASKEEFLWTRENLDLRSLSQSQRLANELQSLQDVYASIVKEHDELAMEQGLFTDVNRVTKRFPQLSAAIYKNMHTIGDKTDRWIYRSMGRVCDMQCENLQWSCWYESD